MRVVWFDDEISDVLGQFLVQALADRGYDVLPLEVRDRPTLVAALDDARAFEPELAIVDMKLGVTDDQVKGVQLIQDLSAQWIGPVLILTRYPKYEALIPFIDPRLQPHEVVKPFTETEADLVEWFGDEVVDGLERAVTRGPVARSVIVEGGDDYFRLPLHELSDLPLEERLDRQAAATRDVLPQFRDCFEDPAVSYVVIAGPEPRVIRAGRGADDRPNVESLQALRREAGAPVTVVRRPGFVNLINAQEPPGCTPSGGPAKEATPFPDWFPTLDVEFKKQETSIHFDTGSDFSFLGFEELGRVAPDRSDELAWGIFPLTIGLSGEQLLQVSDWSVLLRVRSQSGHLQQNLRLLLVRSFAASGLAASCRSHCASYSEDGGLCRFRPGLLGRDILRETGWGVVIDTVRRSAFVVDRDDPILTGDTKDPKRSRWGFDGRR